MRNTKSGLFKIGIVLLIMIAILTIFAPWIAPYGVNEMDPPRLQEDGSWRAPPFPISAKHLLGTDTNGYDILSRLLYGAKYTIGFLIATAILRLIIALPIGMYLGWSEGRMAKLLVRFFQVWTTLPMIIIAFFLLATLMTIDSIILKITFQAVILTVVGIPILSNTIHLHTKEIKKAEFIEGAKVLGGNGLHILHKHIFPHLKPRLLLLWIMELVQVLSIMGQLAIVNVIIGGVHMSFFNGIPTIKPNIPEWTALITISRYRIFQSPYLLLGPLIAYALVLITLVFISEGLKEKEDLSEASYELD